MIKKIVILNLIMIFFISCEKQKCDVLCGVWNKGKLTDEKNAYTIPDYKKNYKVQSGFIVIEKDEKYLGIIYDLSENLYITEIEDKYPEYKLKVKLVDFGLENNKKIEIYYTGIVIVHFIDKNTIWFENQLGEELDNILKLRHFRLKFGPDKIFYRAEQVEKAIPKNKGELE